METLRKVLDLWEKRGDASILLRLKAKGDVIQLKPRPKPRPKHYFLFTCQECAAPVVEGMEEAKRKNLLVKGFTPKCAFNYDI